MVRMMPPLPRILLCALLAPFTLTSLACDGGAQANGPGEGGGQRPAEPVVVKLAPVRTDELPRTVDLVGTLYGDEEVRLSAKVPGRILAILADIGDRVAPGQAIARIDPTDYELVVQQRQLALSEALATLGLSELPAEDFDIMKVATVERARFQSANAKAKLERARQLFQQQPPLISEQDFADLETAYQVAERNYDVAQLEARSQLAQAAARASELATARQRLADTVIRAPGTPLDTVVDPVVSGTPAAPADRFAITQRLVSEGEYVREGDPLFQLIADDPIKLRAGVPERFVADVKVGQPVRLRVEGYNEAFTGAVRRVNPAIDVQSRTFQIEVLIPNADHRLRPGAFARGQVRVGTTTEVVVPGDAVVSYAGIDRIFTVVDGKARDIRVQRYATLDGEVAIRGDLEGIEQVIITNTAELANGVPVRVE